MSDYNKLNKDPVLYNKLYQGGVNYSGVDKVSEGVIKKGDIVAIVQLPSPNGGGDYLIPIEEFKKHRLNVASLCQTYQVAPYFDEKKDEKTASYKPKAGIYVAHEDIKVARGNTIANPQYGVGGAEQIVMPYGKVKIQKAYFDKEMNTSHPLIPIDLNNYENQKGISKETKEQIKYLKNLYKNEIDVDEGSLNLNNKIMDAEMYKIMRKKSKLHENLYKQIGTIYEYSKELDSHEKDFKYINELRHEIIKLKSDLEKKSKHLIVQINKVKNQPDLLNSMSDKNKEHLLNSETYAPEEIKEILNYSKDKMAYLEANLTNDEKQKLGLSDTKEKIADFKIDKDKESRLNEVYEDITREGMIEELGFRSRVYTPQLEQVQEAILCNLKAKDELINLMSYSNNIELDKFYKDNIDIIDKNIDNLIKKEKPLPYKTNVKESINYLNEKSSDINRYSKTGQALENIHKKENIINQINNGILNLESNKYINFDKMQSMFKEIYAYKNNEILCNLQALYNVNELKLSTQDKRIKDLCDKQIKYFNNNIEKLKNQNKYISDDNVKYMTQKVEHITANKTKDNFNLDSKKEAKINLIINDIMPNMNKEFSEKIKSINELSHIDRDLVKLERYYKDFKLKDIEYKKLIKNKEILSLAREKLAKVDKLQPIIDEYNSKKWFKESFGKKHENEIREYNNCKIDLERMNIKDWDDYKNAEKLISDKERDLPIDNMKSNSDKLKETEEKIHTYENRKREIVKSQDKVSITKELNKTKIIER